MSNQIILTKDAPAPIGPYSQAVLANGFLFCSGQIAIDPTSGEFLKGNTAEQAVLVMKNIEALLKAAHLDFTNIVKTTIFLTSMNDFAQVNEIYGKYFKSDPPARSTIAVAALPKGASVEIEIVAKA